MQIIADDAGRNLNNDEMRFVKAVFSNANVSKMKYLGMNGTKIDSSHVNFQDWCTTYTCLSEGGSTQIYFKSNGSYVGSVSSSFHIIKNQICSMSEYKCLDVNVYYATYNCIGWAFGISKWLQPFQITNYIKNHNLTHEQAIIKFAEEIKKDYPNNHISNIVNIADKIDITNISSGHYASINNNTLSLYFDGDECLHGSRFMRTIKEQVLDQWTSKLGKGILVSHNEDDLLYAGSMYGNTAYYMGLIENTITRDEL